MWLSHSKFKEMLSQLYLPQRFLTWPPSTARLRKKSPPPLKYFTPWAPQWKADRQSCQMRGHRSKVWAVRWRGGCEKRGRGAGGGAKRWAGDGFVCREDFTVCRVTESKDGTLSSLLPSWNISFPSLQWNGKNPAMLLCTPKNLRAEFSRELTS